MLYDGEDRMPRLEWIGEFGVTDRQEKWAGRSGCRGRPMWCWVAGFSTPGSARRSGSPSRNPRVWWGVKPGDRWKRGRPTKDSP